MRKRCFDLAVVLVTAVVWLPLLLAVAWLVRLKMGPKVWFRQERPGKDERIFTLLKFRTMTPASILYHS